MPFNDAVYLNEKSILYVCATEKYDIIIADVNN